jgi:hypothetical protein
VWVAGEPVGVEGFVEDSAVGALCEGVHGGGGEGAGPAPHVYDGGGC